MKKNLPFTFIQRKQISAAQYIGFQGGYKRPFYISLKYRKIIFDKKNPHIMIHIIDFISIKSVTCLSITLSFLAALIKVRQYLILNNYLNSLSKYISEWM